MKGFYFDEHIPNSVVKSLRKKGYLCIRAVDVGMEGADDDSEHLPYATEHQLLMITLDHPFAKRTESRDVFFGLICIAYRKKQDIGWIVEELVIFAEIFDPTTDLAQVFWLT
jgi:predicted nuclease of predicted toxin-antitoxin system